MVADRLRELHQGARVALAGEEQAGAAVVPDRARGYFAVAGFDLGEVVVAEEELDALAGAAGDVRGQARDAGEVGGLVEGQEEPGSDAAALLPRLLGGGAEQAAEQRGEEGAAALGVLGGGDEVQGRPLAEEGVEVELGRLARGGGGDAGVEPGGEAGAGGGEDGAALLLGGLGEALEDGCSRAGEAGRKRAIPGSVRPAENLEDGRQRPSAFVLVHEEGGEDIEAARYQCGVREALPSAVRISASSAASPMSARRARGFQLTAVAPNRRAHDVSRSSGAKT